LTLAVLGNRPPGERVAIPFESRTMYGVLRKPWHTPKAPVVILVPGLDSVKEELHIYGNDFLRRGMAVLAIDGPGQGEMEFDYPLRHDYEVPIKYAVDYLESRPDIDSTRVGLMGVSFGGQFVVRAAFVRRVQNVLKESQCYDGAINGRSGETQDELDRFVASAHKKGKPKPARIELAKATAADFEAWLRGSIAYVSMVDHEKGAKLLADLNALPLGS